MTKSREATSPIRGYIYQFNLSILELLKLEANNSSITIEGIEDIDIEHVNGTTETIQCKYYEETEYNHSVISEAIRWMLKHFAENKDSKLKYKLYGHYKSGHHKFTTENLNSEFFKKNFFLYKKNGTQYEEHKDLNLCQKDIVNFIKKLDININAESFDSLNNSIINEIMKMQNCDDVEAGHYYNNALNIIVTLATKKTKSDRKISKSEFIKKISNKDILFNKWLLLYKGEEQYCKEIKSLNFPSGLNKTPRERFFLIDYSYENDLSFIKHLIYLIATKYNKLSKREPDKFCPYLYLHNIPPAKLIELKQCMYNESKNFKDGFDFNGASFNINSIIEKPSNKNPIEFKIIDDIGYINRILNNLSMTPEIFEFYVKAPYFTTNHSTIKHIKIQIPNINMIKNII